jgi:hypothetical protein
MSTLLCGIHIWLLKLFVSSYVTLILINKDGPWVPNVLMDVNKEKFPNSSQNASYSCQWWEITFKTLDKEIRQGKKTWLNSETIVHPFIYPYCHASPLRPHAPNHSIIWYNLAWSLNGVRCNKTSTRLA